MPSLTLVLGGLLSLPALLLQVLLIPIQVILSLPALFFLRQRPQGTLPSDDNAHVIVTGGSSGIGLEIARHYIKAGKVKCVTILARNKERLEIARKDLEQSKNSSNNVTVKAISVDVTDYSALETAAKSLFSSTGRPDKIYLFCCAGAAYANYFQDTPVLTFAQSAQLNQLGPLYTTRAFLPYIRSGHIVFISSACGQIGVFGYTSYSPCKFALRGLAECLHIELSAQDSTLSTNRCGPIHVQVAYPLDTDTPGFANENLTKPRETHLCSDSGGLHSPAEIAKRITRQVRPVNPPFSIACNFDGWMLSQLTVGFGPATSMIDAVSQVSGMNLFRWISLFYLQDWWSIVQKCQRERKDANTHVHNPQGTKLTSSSLEEKEDKID